MIGKTDDFKSMVLSSPKLQVKCRVRGHGSSSLIYL